LDKTSGLREKRRVAVEKDCGREGIAAEEGCEIRSGLT